MKMRTLGTMLACCMTLTAVAAKAADDEARDAARERQALVDRGSYLVYRVAMCVQCHSPRDEQGGMLPHHKLEGATMPLQSPFQYQLWAFRAPPIVGLPVGYTEADVVELLVNGKNRTGTQPKLPMPPYRMTEQDAKAVAAYLADAGKAVEATDVSTGSAQNIPGERAVAVISAIDGSGVFGVVTFKREDGLMHISASFTGLTPGLHGLHIDQNGDCAVTLEADADTHLNPEGKKHGSPDSVESHLGDLGNIVADEIGRAQYDRVDNVLTFSGPNSVIGHTVVVRAGMDDLKSQPAGNAGARVACGVIEKM